MALGEPTERIDTPRWCSTCIVVLSVANGTLIVRLERSRAFLATLADTVNPFSCQGPMNSVVQYGPSLPGLC